MKCRMQSTALSLLVWFRHCFTPFCVGCVLWTLTRVVRYTVNITPAVASSPLPSRQAMENATRTTNTTTREKRVISRWRWWWREKNTDTLEDSQHSRNADLLNWHAAVYEDRAQADPIIGPRTEERSPRNENLVVLDITRGTESRTGSRQDQPTVIMCWY